MYEALAGAAFSMEDPEHVVESVSRLRRDNPRVSREELAGKLTRRAAMTCGAVGAAGGHTAFQALALDRMLLSIARVSGEPASFLERAAAAGVSLLAAGVAEGLRRQALRMTRALPERRSPLLPPIAGMLAGGLLAYGAAELLGLAARRYIFGGRRLKS